MKTELKILTEPSMLVTKSDISHIGIIMDGNGRWAIENGTSKVEAYHKGAEVAQEIVMKANEIGVKFLTLYTFSCENWKRPKEEIEGLMDLLKIFIDENTEEIARNNIRVRVIGDFSLLSDELLAKIAFLENKTRNCKGLQVNIALSYGGRQELVYAIKRLAVEVKTGNINIRDINEETIAEYLYLPDVPDPDLIIRTSGEQRLSNFLLWQSAYSELYFSKITWPDFSSDHFIAAINEYYNRDRRYGS